MSETVHYTGLLTKVERINGETLEQQCKRIMGNIDLPPCFDSYLEMIAYRRYQKYYVHNNELYSVQLHKIEKEDELFISNYNGRMTYDFEIRYEDSDYDFEEAIELALKNQRF